MCHFGVPRRRQRLNDSAIEPIEYLRVLYDDPLRVGLAEAVDKRAEEHDVLQVERAVRAEIREPEILRQPERRLQDVSEPVGEHHR